MKPCFAVASSPTKHREPGPVSRPHEATTPSSLYPAIRSTSSRRTRQEPGRISIFCSLPTFIIRQTVARETPRNLAASPNCINRGAESFLRGGSSFRSSMRSIAASCLRSAVNSFLEHHTRNRLGTPDARFSILPLAVLQRETFSD